MTAVFADASFYAALLSPRDQLHQSAIQISGSLRRPTVVTEFVLIEVANALAGTESRMRAAALWTYLQNDPTVSIVAASADLVARGLEFYLQRPDKEWSLTDCISMLVMEDLGLSEALTADHHFEQAGFVVLLAN